MKEKPLIFIIGLPPASVDHGTALDITNKGIVSPVSIIESILVVAKYAPYWKVK